MTVNVVKDSEMLYVDVDVLAAWKYRWMIMMTDKGKYLILKLDRGSGRPQWNYSVGGENLEESDCLKNFGILIEYALLFDRHTERNVGGVYALLVNIRIAFKFMKEDVLKEVYYTYINLNMVHRVYLPSTEA